MSKLRWVLLGCGLVLFTVLVHRIGLATIAAAFGRLSWRLAIVVWVPFVLVNVWDTLGWRFALTARRVPFASLFAARLTGEAFNATTPTASLGGETVKAALVRRHVGYDESLTSVIVAKTTITVAQVLFLGACLPLLTFHDDAAPWLRTGLYWAFGLETLAVAGFIAAQLMGALGWWGRRLPALGIRTIGEMVTVLDGRLREYYRRRYARVAASTLCHFLGWVTSALEAYVILHLLGIPVSLQTALLVEACGTAIRFASFMIPAHVGALEGGLVATFVALGLGAADGLSFTLVRRIREATWVGLGFLLLLARRGSSARHPDDPLSSAKRRMVGACALLALGALTTASTAWAEGPSDELKVQVDRVLAVYRDPERRGSAHRAGRQAALRDAMDAAIDFTEVSRRALGPVWTARTAAERQEFVNVFGDFLRRAYLGQVDRYDDEKLLWDGERVNADEASVYSRIEWKDGDQMRLEFKMLRGDDGRWRVYDVLTDGLSLLDNYRAQFRSVLRRSSFDDLVKRIKTQGASPKGN